MKTRTAILAVTGWGCVLVPLVLSLGAAAKAGLGLAAVGLGLLLLLGSRKPSRSSVLLDTPRLLGASAVILAFSLHLIPIASGLAVVLPAAVGFMTLPFLACLVLTGIHVYLGVHVIARGVIFVDLCLAQIAALGTLFAFLVGFAAGSPASYGVSLLFTFIGAVLFSFANPGKHRVPLEAIIGIVYAMATAVTLLILSRAPHEAEHIRDILTGSLLWVSPHTVIKTAAIYGFIGVFHTALYPVFSRASFKHGGPIGRQVWWDVLFYLSFGFVITSSVAIAGVLLVFSFLVIPAMVAMLLARNLPWRLAIGWAVGTAVSVASLAVSYAFDIPSGPCVVTFFGLAFLLTAGGRGVVGRFFGGVGAGGGR